MFDDYKVMIIPEGSHSSLNWKPEIHFGTKGEAYVFSFQKDCLYTYKEIGDTEKDINKLFGFSYGILPSLKGGVFKPAHQVNSFRIGWNVDEKEDKFNLYAYWYKNGVRNSIYLMKVVPHTDVFCYITVNGFDTLIEIENNSKPSDFVIPVGFDTNKWGYYLNPYFGGQARAPHDMSILMNKL